MKTQLIFNKSYPALKRFLDLIMTTVVFSKFLLKSSIIFLLYSIFISNSVNAQDTLIVKGLVLNSGNIPIANVSVGIEGSAELPSVTNELGEFSLKAMSGDAWINIAPSGDYKNKRIFLNSRTDLKIYLTSSNIEGGGDEFRFFSKNFLKKDLISSVSTVKPDNILNLPVLSVDQYLQGRVAGMNVTNRSGFSSSGAYATLRGINSINTDNRPLYIVDGIPLTNLGVFRSNLEGYQHNALLGISPLDISKITILKDALFTAAYGSKGSNGIVLIETLDPSATETVIEVDFRTSYSPVPENQIPQLNSEQHRTLVSENLFSTGMQEEQLREDFPILFLTPEDDRYIDYQHNTNWQDYIFSNAISNNFNIKVKGGDEIARYGLSFGYVNSDGIIRNTAYDGYNLRFVGLLNIFSWLKMNAGVSLNYSNSYLKESGKVIETNPILTSLLKSPMINPYQYDDKGEELAILSNVDELGVSNPLAVIENHEAFNNNFNFTSNLGFIAEISSNLTFNSNFGLNYNILKEENFMPNKGMELYYNDEAINVSESTNNTLTSFNSNNYLVFDKKINNNHSFSSVTGINILTNKYELDWALTKNAHENDQYRMLQDGTSSLWDIGGANRDWNWLSVYENLSYNFKDRYLAMASVSFDGSSRVGKEAVNTIKIADIPFGIFYSAGAAWRISNESFLKNVAALEDLKIRFTYGLTGNDDIGESSATKYYKIVKFRDATGLYPALLANEQLSYETVSKMNLGLDLSLLGYRFTANIDVFKSLSENLLVYVPLDPYFGYDFRPENNGVMENEGIEIHTFLRVVDRPEFKWDIEAWYSMFTNNILEIKGDKLISSFLGGEIVNQEGEQANSYYGYLYKGVYATSEEATEKGLVNERLIPYQAGDAIFEDLSGPDGEPDGIINFYDKTIIGSPTPEFFGGFSSTFRYKRWSLSAFVNFVQGNELFNYIRYQNERMTGLENQDTKVLARWQYEGQDTDIPRALYNDPIGNSSFSTRWIEDGSYIRLKNITLNYTIPNEFLALKNAQFYISANNIYTITDYLGFDPEFAHSHDNLSQGIDYGLTPQTKQFIIGIKLGL